MNLFDYVDYRSYLKDFYLNKKKGNSSYSYRVFANKAKLSSPNYLKLVIDHKRRITDKNLPQFVRGLKLNPQEAEYFKSLVLHEETRDGEAKITYLKEVERIRKKYRRSAQELEESRIEILKSWHHWAIREMVLLQDFQNDPKWISARLNGKISEKQAEESLELLEKLKFIGIREGRFRLAEPLLSTSDEVSSLLIQQLHRQFLELGIQSISQVPVEKRELSGLTIALPQNRVQEFKKMLKEFRKELNRAFSQDHSNEEVYHLVISFFPLTRSSTTKGRLL